MMGYRYDGEKYVIVPEEAEVVRSIFRDYLDGKGVAAIMKRLNEEGILTQQGWMLWRFVMKLLNVKMKYTNK